MKSTTFLKGLTATLRRTWRTVRRSPAFAAGVVATLGLGLGVNAAMFQVLERIMLRPPAHVVRSEEVRRIYMERELVGKRRVSSTLTYPDFLDLRRIPGLASVGAFTPRYPYTVGSGPDAMRAQLSMASHDFFTTLGARPFRGRFYGPDDDRAGAVPTVVLGYEYWERAFGSDPDVLGRTIDIREVPHTIIGITPKAFTGLDLEAVDLWVPIEASSTAIRGNDSFKTQRGSWWLQTAVRTRDEQALDAALERATALMLQGREEEIRRGYFDAGARIFAGPVIKALGPEASEASRVSRWLVGVAAIVLLIACANVANLLLARGARQRREIAIRISLGISRARLAGELLAEALWLALLGGGVAVALAWRGGDLLRRALLPDVLWTSSGIGTTVVGFTLALSVGAGLLAGVGPALRSAKVDLTQDLKDGSRGGSSRRSRLRRSLVVFQAAFSTVLLVGAGLFVKSLDHVRHQDLGIDADRVVMVELELSTYSGSQGDGREVALQASDALAALPSVASVAMTDSPFMWAFGKSIRVPGRDSVPSFPGGGPYWYRVSPGYFETLGLAITHGRELTPEDVTGHTTVAVVSATTAGLLWPGEDPLGQCFYAGRDESCTTVVGVSEDASRGSIAEEPYLALYVPLSEDTAPNAIYLRSLGDIDETVIAADARLRGLSPRIRYASVRRLRDLLDPQAASWRLGATLFTLFGALALVVAAVGLYSLLAFDVAQQTREIGIRRALGAARRHVLREVVMEGARPALLGIALGVAAAAFASRWIEDLLFEVQPRDPGVFGVVTGILVLVSLVASLVPALRAAHVDAMVALRSE